jgi:hypothetical protein
VEETPQLVPVLRGLWEFYELQGELQTARELGEQLLALAQRICEVDLLLVAHNVLGDTLIWLGEFAGARAHLEQGMALYHPQQHRSHAFLYGYDSGVHCLSFGAWALGISAIQTKPCGVSTTRSASPRSCRTPLALAFAPRLCSPGSINCAYEGQAAQERAETNHCTLTDQGFPFWGAWGTILRAGRWRAGTKRRGMAQMRQGIAAWRATELSCNGRTIFAPAGAEARGKAGQAEEGLRVLAGALTAVHKTGELTRSRDLSAQGGVLLEAAMSSMSKRRKAVFTRLLKARRQQAKS